MYMLKTQILKRQKYIKHYFFTQRQKNKKRRKTNESVTYSKTIFTNLYQLNVKKLLRSQRICGYQLP